MLLRVGEFSTSLKSPYRKSITASLLFYSHSASMELLHTLKRAGQHIFKVTGISGALRTGKTMLSTRRP
jgi:hypothetical protein